MSAQHEAHRRRQTSCTESISTTAPGAEFECAFTCDVFEALHTGIVAAGSFVRAKWLLGRKANTIFATRAWRWPKMNTKRREEDKNGSCGVYTLYRLRTRSPLQ
jgi:hypothetical protein